MIKRLIYGGLVFALTVISASAVNKATADTDVIQAFDDIAFGSEVRSLKRRKVVTKWTTADVRVSLVAFDERGGRLRPVPVPLVGAGYVWRHLARLQGLTGIKFADEGTATGAAAGGPPGLTVVFAPTPLLAKVPLAGVTEKLQRELAGPAGCYFVIRADQGAIRRSFIVVNTDRPETEQDHCLLEELTQSLGLPNDTYLLRPSIFSDRDRLTELTATDALFVEWLYHPNLRAGMGRDDALSQVRLLEQAGRWNMPTR